MGVEELADLRKKIDKIDRTIIENLIKRFDVVKKIGKEKKKLKIGITDTEREKEIFENIFRISKRYRNEINKIYRTIVKESKKLEL
jgi:chorismate mutase